jgi:hypothetical protein
MKHLKLFESFEEDDLGIIDLYGSRCTISISIGVRYDCDKVELVPQMIEDYKEMYIRNDEWSGGPCNTEWLEKYHEEFNTTVDIARRAWKPVVVLNIKTDRFGVIKIGFSIYSKKIASFDWSKTDIKDEYYQKSLDNLHKYIRKEIFDKKMEFDEVINFLDLNCDFYYTSIQEDNI